MTSRGVVGVHDHRDHNRCLSEGTNREKPGEDNDGLGEDDDGLGDGGELKESTTTTRGTTKGEDDDFTVSICVYDDAVGYF